MREEHSRSALKHYEMQLIKQTLRFWLVHSALHLLTGFKKENLRNAIRKIFSFTSLLQKQRKCVHCFCSCVNIYSVKWPVCIRVMYNRTLHYFACADLHLLINEFTFTSILRSHVKRLFVESSSRACMMMQVGPCSALYSRKKMCFSFQISFSLACLYFNYQ